ncbi:hypothetical protein [Caldisphaera sp.]|uniref:hypothetical protein n=1 Tax=Caldisphaera sp. TaxID=2060322 RepID=UPI0025C5818A|nr:hypothetical protein [Caldisphaera sp.]
MAKISVHLYEIIEHFLLGLFVGLLGAIVMYFVSGPAIAIMGLTYVTATEVAELTLGLILVGFTIKAIFKYIEAKVDEESAVKSQ